MSVETSAFARRFQLDVSTDGVSWVPFKGIQDLNPSEKPTVVDTTDYDTSGFASKEKPITSWSVVVKARRPVNAGVFDPGQEICRAAMFQFGSAARVYVRWYDRNNAPEAWSGVGLVSYVESKTAVADVEEITVTFDGDGVLTKISNPSTVPLAPVITNISPTTVHASTLLAIQGAYFTGATSVKLAATSLVAGTGFNVISDSMIEAAVPSAQSAGTVAVTVTNAVGTSTGYSITVS